MARSGTTNGYAPALKALFTPAEWTALETELELSPRERQILEVMLEGVKDTVVAQRVGMAKDTLRSHITRLHRKLGVTNRTQLLVRLFRSHLEIIGFMHTVRAEPSVEIHARRLTHVRR